LYIAHLDLSYNQIGPPGALKLAGVLPKCAALVYLDLSGNYMGADGAGTLAGVLAQCTALTYLNLSKNYIRGAGAESLAQVLPQCASLVYLDLSDNGIGEDSDDEWGYSDEGNFFDEVALGLREAWTGDPLKLVI
jgi:hypothetical protein